MEPYLWANTIQGASEATGEGGSVAIVINLTDGGNSTAIPRLVTSEGTVSKVFFLITEFDFYNFRG